MAASSSSSKPTNEKSSSTNVDQSIQITNKGTSPPPSLKKKKEPHQQQQQQQQRRRPDAVWLGPILLLLGCILLWFNEFWTVQTHRIVAESLERYITLPTDDNGSYSLSEILQDRNRYEDRLVYSTDLLTVTTPAMDPFFDLTPPSSPPSTTTTTHQAMIVSRIVEIYQWVETTRTRDTWVEKKEVNNKGIEEVVGGSVESRTTYRYNKKWVSKPINSTSFTYPEPHSNIGELPYESELFFASGIQLGGTIGVSTDLVQQLLLLPKEDNSSSSTTNVSAIHAKSIPPEGEIVGDVIYFPIVTESNKDSSTTTLAFDEDTKPEDFVEQTIIAMDGEEKVLFMVQPLGESFSSEDKAIEAAQRYINDENAKVLEELERELIEERKMVMDGEEKILYTVKLTGKSFSSKDKALEEATKAVEEANRPPPVGEIPQIGDVRVTFTEVPTTTVSVLGQFKIRKEEEDGQGLLFLSSSWSIPTSSQKSSTTSTTTTDTSIGILVKGIHSAEEMILQTQTISPILTSLRRLGGFVLVWMGVLLMTQIVVATTSTTSTNTNTITGVDSSSRSTSSTLVWLPFLGPTTIPIIQSLGVHLARIVLTLSTTISVMAVAWILHRPLVGMGMLIISLGLVFVLSSVAYSNNCKTKVE